MESGTSEGRAGEGSPSDCDSGLMRGMNRMNPADAQVPSCLASEPMERIQTLGQDHLIGDVALASGHGGPETREQGSVPTPAMGSGEGSDQRCGRRQPLLMGRRCRETGGLEPGESDRQLKRESRVYLTRFQDWTCPPPARGLRVPRVTPSRLSSRSRCHSWRPSRRPASTSR
jgi:hypothetical protein